MRIGVSLGEATVEDGDYFGEPVVESARLCAHAAGGQIVVNALVRQLGGSRDGHSFDSLGGLELKGISEPVDAFELQWEPAACHGHRAARSGCVSSRRPPMSGGWQSASGSSSCGGRRARGRCAWR